MKNFLIALFCSWLIAPVHLVAGSVLRRDLNTASYADLVVMPGIGPKTALKIIERRKVERFSRMTQLLKVGRIGKKRLATLGKYLFIRNSG